MIKMDQSLASYGVRVGPKTRRHEPDDFYLESYLRETIVNARTAGKAKAEFLRILDGCYPDLKFTDIRVRKLGPAHTSQSFRRTAQYRGTPTLRCGARVRVGEDRGTIVANNSSANFDVLFDDDSPHYPGLRLNVHPQSITLIQGEIQQ